MLEDCMDRSPLTTVAIVGGALVAATLLSLITFAPGVVTGLANGRTPIIHASQLNMLLFLFIAAWILGVLGAATFGVAWHTIALKRGWTNVFAYMFVGALLGAALPAAATAPIWVGEMNSRPTEPLGQAFSMLITIAGAIMGPLTALFAWLIRRPDRDQTPASSSKDTSA
jgi:hypothetical protein